jgi:hypothetical protein
VATSASGNGRDETFILRKHAYERGFTILDNQLLQDVDHLSLRAIGLGALLWSLPVGTPTNATELASRCKEGRDAIREALNELAAAGYLRRNKRSEGRGRWIHTIELADIPIFRDGFSGAEADQRKHGESPGQFSDAVSGPENPSLRTKGPKAKDRKDTSPNGDGGGASDGRSDTITGKGIDALGFAPVERGAFAKILTDAENNNVPEEVILRAVKHWGDGAEPMSWLTNHIGQLHRAHMARQKRTPGAPGSDRVAHDGQHDPDCWCYQVPEDQRAKVHRGDLLRAAGLTEQDAAEAQERLAAHDEAIREESRTAPEGAS